MAADKSSSIRDNLIIDESDKFFSDSIIPRVLTSAVKISTKSQAEIASELNLNPNVITMFKQGRTKVPITRAAELAKVLGISQTEFVRLILEEHHSDVLNTIEKTFVLSKNEKENEAFDAARLKL